MSLIGQTKMAIIESLDDAPKHGYDLHEEIGRATSTVYSHLDELEQAGMVTSKTVAADSGRERKVYSLTPAGEQLLDALRSAD